MAYQVAFKIEGLERLQDAMRQAPETVRAAAKHFIILSASHVRRVIQNDPWRVWRNVTGPPGGVPVATGNLRQAHRTELADFEAKIFPDQGVAPYAGYVHEGTKKRDGSPRMAARPWLEHAGEAA